MTDRDLVTGWFDALAPAFGSVRIVVVGDVMVDEYVAGECTRISPEAPVPVLQVRSITAVPGGAANTAANIAGLGGRPVLVSAVGDDSAGDTLRKLLGERSVESVLGSDWRPTIRKVRAVAGQQQLLRLDFEDERGASAELRASLVSAVRSLAGGARAIVVSDYAKRLLDATSLSAIRQIASEVGVPLIIDPRPEHGEWYAGSDYLTPNWKEALLLTGNVDSLTVEDSSIDRVGWQLVDRFGSNVVLTLGPRGIRFFDRTSRRSFHEDALAREVFDVSGAGDTVVAAFTLALATGADAATAVRLANAAAGVVVGRLGTAVVTVEDVRAAILREASRP